jgi:hypothetical protein
VTIPSQFLQELLALCGPEDHELRERVLKSAAPAHPVEGVPAQAVAVADARSARQITDAIVENFKDAGWYVPSVDEALVLEAVSAAIVEHGASEPLTGVASDVDSMARVLMAAFAKAEPEHPITRYPTSFVATFADMARAAIAAAQLADGVPAQSYVADFFREKGFYPSPAQAFAAGVAHAAAMPAQSVDEIMELADEYAGAQACAVTATSTADADTTKERNAMLSAIRAALAATQPAAQGMDAQRSAYAAKGAKEVFCKKCEMTVISNCGSASGCPVRNIYAAQAKQGGAA